MVRIVNKIDFAFLMILIFVVSLCSCAVLRTDVECKLNPLKNEIVGKGKGAPTLEIKSLYLPSLIGYLYEDRNIIEAHLNGYNWMKYPIYEGFKITGCLDTTRAKIMMADHLLNKYDMIRKDSVYLDTIYRIEIVEPNKLPINEDCNNNNIFTYTKDSTEIYSSRTCLHWDSFFINIIDHLCSRHHCKPLEIPKGGKMMDMITPIRMKLGHDIEGMLKYYEEVYGVRVTQERIDSIEFILYKGSLEMKTYFYK